MARNAKSAAPVRLSDLVRELPPETRFCLFMEDIKGGWRKELLTGDEDAAEQKSVLAEFANAIIRTVVKAGKTLRVVYLDDRKTTELAGRMKDIDYGEQISMLPL